MCVAWSAGEAAILVGASSVVAHALLFAFERMPAYQPIVAAASVTARKAAFFQNEVVLVLLMAGSTGRFGFGSRFLG